MTLLRPTLSLRRLVVLKSGRALYDQPFHRGLNIIRGENSSGKSTIADFIFFSLGGDLQRWTPEAAAADSVHAEVAINGTIYTLSRDVQPHSHPPLHIFEGPYSEATRSREQWLRYPYSRSGNSESFSQVLFNLLGLPEQKTEAQQNITIHQLLRLLYVDQITSVEEIFRHERFDNRDIRMAVGELLLGIDDLEMHDLRLRLRETDSELSEIEGEIRSVLLVLEETDQAEVPSANYQEKIAEALAEQRETRRNVDELTQRRAEEQRTDVDERTTGLYENLRQTKAEMAAKRREEQSIAFDLEDSKEFVKTLDERLVSLSASEDMVAILGNVRFRLCPACFQALDAVDEDAVCHLCKAPVSGSGPWAGHLKMREELTFQLRESKRLIDKRHTDLRNIRNALAALVQKRRSLEAKLSAFERFFHTTDAEIELHLQRIGYLDGFVEDLNRRSKLAELVAQRSARRRKLKNELISLRDQLQARAATRERRAKEVGERISRLCVDVLRNDLPQEETFQVAEIVEFDFGKNKISANGRERFSASSMTLLKNAFITSLLGLSMGDTKVRWPRFVLLDNIEDKGMQPNRSANFQEWLAARLANVEVESQVILMTSMISPELDNTPYCVGPYHSHDNKTLDCSE